MTQNYDYLKRYIGHNDLRGTYFLPVSSHDVKEAEAILGYEMPSQLKTFYQEVGTGILSCGEKYPQMYAKFLTNQILPPLVVANFAKGILRWEGQDNWMAEPTYEFMEPGDLPFFEIGDSSRFLFMKPRSDTPNAVWNIGNIKIEDSFERFIHRLYYESPWFYDDIIEAHNK